MARAIQISQMHIHTGVRYYPDEVHSCALFFASYVTDDMIKLDKQEEEDPRARRGMGGGMGGMPGM